MLGWVLAVEAVAATTAWVYWKSLRRFPLETTMNNDPNVTRGVEKDLDRLKSGQYYEANSCHGTPAILRLIEDKLVMPWLTRKFRCDISPARRYSVMDRSIHWCVHLSGRKGDCSGGFCGHRSGLICESPPSMHSLKCRTVMMLRENTTGLTARRI
jgi:hypothetical protein